MKMTAATINKSFKDILMENRKIVQYLKRNVQSMKIQKCIWQSQDYKGNW